MGQSEDAVKTYPFDRDPLKANFSTAIEKLTASNPHCDDPRYLQYNQQNACRLRYTMFCRCARDLDPDHARCKYQYYRSQVACPLEFMDAWDEQRENGNCKYDVPVEKSVKHMRQ